MCAYVLMKPNEIISPFDIEFINIKNNGMKASKYMMLLGNKIPMFIGYGIIMEIKNNKVKISIKDTSTVNILTQLMNLFEIDLDLSNIYLNLNYFHNKVNQMEIGQSVCFMFEIVLTYYMKFSGFEYTLKSIRKDKHLHLAVTFLRLIKELKKKRMIEFVFHPDNIDFKEFFAFLL